MASVATAILIPLTRLRLLAHAVIVAPVVKTSSMRSMNFPVNSLPSQILKASSTFFFRSSLFISVCVFVFR